MARCHGREIDRLISSGTLPEGGSNSAGTSPGALSIIESSPVPWTTTWSQDYLYRGLTALATLHPGVTGEALHHLHPDHLGTPRLVTGPGGNVLAHHTYLPFGYELTDPHQAPERKRFTGHERDLNYADPLLGGADRADDLDYMHARLYSPELARFLGVDPVLGNPKTPQSWNRYAYVFGSPLVHTDPDGRRAILVSPLQMGNVLEVLEPQTRLGLSLAVGFLPGIGEFHDASQALLRRDVITGEKLSSLERGIAFGAFMVPIAGATLGRKAGGFVTETPKGAELSEEALKGLTTSQRRSVRSLERQIAKHQTKLEQFRANPTVRPGMNTMSDEAIKAQQAARIQHLETEIRTFKRNIQKILDEEH